MNVGKTEGNCVGNIDGTVEGTAVVGIAVGTPVLGVKDGKKDVDVVGIEQSTEDVT